MTTDVEQAPPRRQGRSCGYTGQPELLAANRALGGALHKLARDPDPAARLVGAELAQAVAELVAQAATVAADSTTVAQRQGAEVARRLPRLLAEFEQAKAQLIQGNRHYPVSDITTKETP